MNNLIGVSGKIGSGKDTVGKTLQYLNCSPPSVDKIDHMMKFITDDKYKSNLDIASNYQIKKFADKLKDMICILLGCTREQLEDREFKEKELGEEWWYYKGEQTHFPYIKTKAENSDIWHEKVKERVVKLTPRKLLQLLGTDCGRDIIHPNIWINALFNDYKVNISSLPNVDFGTQLIVNNVYKDESGKKHLAAYPNWIITDVRFPDEVKAIEDRGGIVIRINRKITSDEWQKLYPKVIVLNPDGWNRDERYQYEWFEEKITLEEYKLRVMRSTCKFEVDFQDYFEEHPSETALDNHDFKYVIENNGSIEELVETVKQLL